ncbi:SDR family oxidoreductase [Parahaliea mediterranea]|uniref:Vi polysaccharide biosynthesis UDP-N-acetylglucosaminuronic acid C-4 epimerase TviC n=1 Tax=Parahaliea mediterranea TaxID=651086 RepID=A0A939DFX2_9GAMM|nr:SDR family oxidoreductase [Parahaliea mediterranea]MBN7797464.1 Vi polysaccharide biosynthesis UDP-N-acetylglucosaminuronic acid C-4 epimerase TviC [Parahaliea mediterranea]
MTALQALNSQLRSSSSAWLVTGAAGFIGSNLVEALLRAQQRVVGLDNLSTGYRENLEDVRSSVGEAAWQRFTFIEGDICDLATCQRAAAGVDYVLHQAALGSVPRSLEDPLGTNQSNVSGFLNMLLAARDAGVRRFVYAASSSTYGDHPGLPKVEDEIGRPLSPYAVTKYVNELYAEVFGRCYAMDCIGLRYFNVFGPRQDPGGAYAAVIPRWIEQLLRGEECRINGDGETSRDFCYVDNAVLANLLAATATEPAAANQVFNVAVGDRTTLNELFALIRDQLREGGVSVAHPEPAYNDFREGDVRHSQADIGKARALLGYAPDVSAARGLALTTRWFLARHEQPTAVNQ